MNNKRSYYDSGGREGAGPSRGGVDPKLLIPTESQIDEFIETLKGSDGRRGVEERRNYQRPQDLVYRPYEKSNAAENQRSAFRSRSRSRSRSPEMRRSPRRDRRPSPSDRRDSRKRSSDRLGSEPERYQRSQFNEQMSMPMNQMGFVAPQFNQGMMDPRMMTMNPIMTQQMMTQMMAMMPQMMGMMNPMMMQPFLAAAAAAQKAEAKTEEEPPPPPKIKEKSPIDKKDWKSSSRVPTPPPPPMLSECKKVAEKEPPKKKEADILSSLLGNKDVSLSSLLEAAIEPKGSKRHIEDPVLKKQIVEQCEKRISQLYKLKNNDGAFIPDPVTKVCSEDMLFNHPYLEFSCESKPVAFWCCPKVKVPEKKIQIRKAEEEEKEKIEKEEKDTFSIETINREELIVPLNLPIQSYNSYLPSYQSAEPPSLDSLPPVPKVPPRTYDIPIESTSRMVQPMQIVDSGSSSDDSYKKRKSRKKRKKHKRKRSRSRSRERRSRSRDRRSQSRDSKGIDRSVFESTPQMVPPPSYQPWNNPVPTPVPAPVPAPVPSPSVNLITHPWLKQDVSNAPVKTPVLPNPTSTRNDANLQSVKIENALIRPVQNQPPVHRPLGHNPMYNPPPIGNPHPGPMNHPAMPVQNYGPNLDCPPNVDHSPGMNYMPPGNFQPSGNFPPPGSNYHPSTSFPPNNFPPGGPNFPPPGPNFAPGGPNFAPGVPNFHGGPNFPQPGNYQPPGLNNQPFPVTYPPPRNQPPYPVRCEANITIPINTAPSNRDLEVLREQFKKVFSPISNVTDDLKTFQETDTTCSGIKARLMSGKSTLTDVFTLYDGLLCRIEDFQRHTKCIQIVIPKSCIYKAITAIHNANHSIKEKMLETLINDCFYCLGDVSDLITAVFNKCDICVKPKPRSLSRERYRNEILSQRPGALVLPKIKVNLKTKNPRQDSSSSVENDESPKTINFKNDQFHFYRKQVAKKPKLYDDSDTIDLTEQEKQNESSKVPPVDFKTRVRETQMKNETLKNMIDDLENDKPSDPSYILKGSMLCQKVTIDKNSVVRIVADLEHIRDFCFIVHTMASIHAPFEKSLIIFKKHFIPIDGIDEILKNVVESCETCQQN